MKQSIFGTNKDSVITLGFLTFLVFAKCLFFDFSPMDEDWLIIRDEPFIRDWGTLVTSFNDSIQGVYYRPLLIWTFVLDYHIGHLSPFIYHFTNLLLHFLCVVTLYKLLIVLKTDRMLAFLLAAIFSVHPLSLHAVSWIPGRNDVLLCLFSLLSIYHLVLYLDGSKQKNVIFHFLFFMMALLSKENAVFLLPVFVFVSYGSKPFGARKMILLCFGWLIQIGVWYVLMTRVIKISFGSGADHITTAKNFITGFLIFLGKAFVPIQQSVSPNVSNSQLEIILGIVVFVFLLYAAFRLNFNNRKLAVLGLMIYFVLLVVPVWFGAISPIGEHLEHRSYTSLIGMFIFVGQIRLNPTAKTVQVILYSVIILFAIKTFMRMDVYKDGFSYITEASEDCPRNYFFQARMGNFLFDAKRIPESVECYNKAIALYDKKPQVFNDRANSYVLLGKKDEAIADYTRAYELGKEPNVILFRCLTYKRFNDYENAYKDLEYLAQCCREVIPKGLDQEIIKGLLEGRFNEVNKMIAAEPNNAILYVNRAKLYMDRRMGREALSDLKKACELEPNNKEYQGYYNELNSSLPH